MTAPFPSTIRDKTLELIQNRSTKLELKDIAAATGLKKSWLSAFANGQIPDPAIGKVQTLYEYLTNTKIPVV